MGEITIRQPQEVGVAVWSSKSGPESTQRGPMDRTKERPHETNRFRSPVGDCRNAPDPRSIDLLENGLGQ
jgi:hypothetical protein